MLPTDVSYYDYMVILWNNLVFGSSLFGNGSDKLHSEWLLSKSSYFLYIQDDITSATMVGNVFILYICLTIKFGEIRLFAGYLLVFHYRNA